MPPVLKFSRNSAEQFIPICEPFILRVENTVRPFYAWCKNTFRLFVVVYGKLSAPFKLFVRGYLCFKPHRFLIGIHSFTNFFFYSIAYRSTDHTEIFIHALFESVYLHHSFLSHNINFFRSPGELIPPLLFLSQGFFATSLQTHACTQPSFFLFYPKRR